MPRKPRRGQPRHARKAVVIAVCLYPSDLVHLDTLTRGRNRMRSVVVRHLIRTTKKINETDLVGTLGQDDLLKKLTPATIPSFGFGLIEASD